jgi:hypothetical protein
MATDDYGQSITIPALTDQPNIATVASALQLILKRAILSFTSASSRNATLTSPTEGMMAWLQDTNTMTQYDGTTWQTVLNGGTWTSYTPAWTASTTNPVLGNGTLVGRYSKVGKMVDFAIQLTAGSTTTFGSGQWSFSLPFTVASNLDMIGNVMVGDASGDTSDYSSGAAYIPDGGTTLQAYAGGKGDMALITATFPQTWANGDRLWITGRYEAV